MKKLDTEPRLQGASASVVEWARAVVRVVNQLVDAVAGLSSSKAPIDSPTFTGTPKAPTPPTTDNSTRLSTTAWIRSAMSDIASAAGFSASFGTTWYIKFPSWLGGGVIQGGTSVVITDGSGNAAVTFPLTYPTAVRSTMAMSGDSAVVSGAALLSMYTTGWPTNSGFAVHVCNSTNAVPTGTASVRINWISVGN